MKKFIIAFFVVAILVGVLIYALWPKGTTPNGIAAEIQKLNDEQREVLQAVHYANWIMALSNPDYYPNQKLDKRDLEFHYKKLTDEIINDNYNFRTIGTAKNVITQLIKDINTLRIEDGERRMLEQSYKIERQRLLWSCLPKNMAVIVDVNWKQIIANVVQTAFYSTMNYLDAKSALNLKYKKESWELTKNEWNHKAQSAQETIKELTDLFSQYDIDDSYCVNKEAAGSLWKLIAYSTTIPENSPDFIRAQKSLHTDLSLPNYEQTYKFFPMYWYYRGVSAYQYDKKSFSSDLKFNKISLSGDTKDAKKCFDIYQVLCKHFQVRKVDPISAEVAIRQIELEMAEEKPNSDFIREQLMIVQNNCTPQSVQEYLFCGLVYYYMLPGDSQTMYKCAADMFQHVLISGRFLEERVNEFCKNMDDEVVIENPNEDAKTKDIPTDPIFKYNGDDDKEYFLPNFETMFFARAARFQSLIKAYKDQDLVDRINDILSADKYTSPMTLIFFAANVKEPATKEKYYKEILPKALEVPLDKLDLKSFFANTPWKNVAIGKIALPYDITFFGFDSNLGDDDYILEMPLKYALLDQIEYQMIKVKDGKEEKVIPYYKKVIFQKELEDADGEKYYIPRFQVYFEYDCKEFKSGNDKAIIFRMKHPFFTADIKYDLSKVNEDNYKDKDFYENIVGKLTFTCNPQVFNLK